MTRVFLFSCLAALLALGCDSESPDPDAGPDDPVDAGSPSDAGPAPMDAGPSDAGPPPDDGGPPPGDAGNCGDDGTDDVIEGATPLGDIGSGDSFPAGTEDVIVFDVTDRDWFSFTDADELTGDVQPRANLTGLPGGPRYELCAYYECDTALQRVDCDMGTAHELSAERHGCCSVGTGTELSVVLSPHCDTTDESGTVYVRVAQQGGTATCDMFSLEWGDD